jgi:hypothetical protein
MTNQYDDDRPLSQRSKSEDQSLSPDDAAARYDAIIGRPSIKEPPPIAPTVRISQEQIEAIAEAVANRVIAKLREEPK